MKLKPIDKLLEDQGAVATLYFEDKIQDQLQDKRMTGYFINPEDVVSHIDNLGKDFQITVELTTKKILIGHKAFVQMIYPHDIPVEITSKYKNIKK